MGWGQAPVCTMGWIMRLDGGGSHGAGTGGGPRVLHAHPLLMLKLPEERALEVSALHVTGLPQLASLSRKEKPKKSQCHQIWGGLPCCAGFGAARKRVRAASRALSTCHPPACARHVGDTSGHSHPWELWGQAWISPHRTFPWTRTCFSQGCLAEFQQDREIPAPFPTALGLPIPTAYGWWCLQWGCLGTQLVPTQRWRLEEEQSTLLWSRAQMGTGMGTFLERMY